MGRALFTVLALCVGCAGPRTLVAPGAMTDLLNQSLAKTTAANRALSELLPLLRTEGLTFRLAITPFGRTFVVESNETSGRPSSIEYQPLHNGWLAFVTVERPTALEQEMAQLDTVTVTATAERDALPVAMRDAKSAALEMLVAAAVGDGTGALTGTITLTEMDYTLPETTSETSRVSVQLTGIAKVSGREELTAEEAEAVADSLLESHAQAGQWTEALSTVEGFLTTYPDHLKYRVLLAALHVQLNDREKAEAAANTAMRKLSWEDAQNALADAEEFVGADLVDEVETMAVDGRLISPPTIGPPPRTVVNEEPATSPNRAKKKKRRRRKRR